MLSKVIVEGFKSFCVREEVPFKPLTLLAGSNSSGKSSLMQPLLLLKQTFQDTSDPGPLRINGPHVVFSRAEQMIWHAPGEKERLNFNVGLELSLKGETSGVEVFFPRRMKPRGLPSLQIAKCIWSSGPDEAPIEVRASFSEDEIRKRFSNEITNLRDILTELKENSQSSGGDSDLPPLSLEVTRQRSFLIIEGHTEYVNDFETPAG